MSNEFQIPAKPWGDSEIKTMMANQSLLDNETRAELGLAPSEEAPTPSEEPTVEEPIVEAPETQEEPVVETEEANQEAPQEETVENLDSQEA